MIAAVLLSLFFHICSLSKCMEPGPLNDLAPSEDPQIELLSEKYMAFRNACKSGQLTEVSLLLTDSKVDPAAMDNEALINAIRGGHLEIVKLLLADSRIISACHVNQVLQLACRLGKIEIVKHLLEHYAFDPRVLYNATICEVMESKNMDLARLLLADPRVDP